MAVKRYCIGGKIVETYLDHVDNPRVSHLLQWDKEAKQALAERFSRLPNDVINTFALGYRNADPNLLKQALQRIATCLKLQMDFDLADVIMGCYERIDYIAKAEREALIDVPGGAMASLNLPVFVSFATLADNLGVSAGASRGVMIHDETKEYEQTFRWIFEAFRDATTSKLRFLGGQEYQIGYECLKEFRTTPSISEPLIQAADRLAGVIRLYATQALKDGKVLPAIAEMAVQVMPLAIFYSPSSASIIGTESFDDSFFAPIRSAITLDEP